MALMNLRNALMTGKRLPYDAEVEFLENVVGAYIDTGFVPSSSNIEASLLILIPAEATQSTAYDALFGCAKQDGQSMFILAKQQKQPYVFFRAGTSSLIGGVTQVNTGSIINASVTLGANNSFTAVVGTRTMTGSYNGSVGLATNGACVFAVANNNTIILPTIGGYHVGHVLIKEDGATVFDGIPVRVGTVGYLYDRVSGALFGNAGTGDFVLGPDVVPVEYLDFTGTQCLDLGFHPTQATTTSIDIIPSVTGTSNIGWVSAGNGAGVKYESYGWSNRAQVYYGGESDVSWSVYDGDHIKMELGKNTKYENITQGTTYSKIFTDTTFTAAYNLTIGALNSGVYSYFAQMRLNSASITGDRTMNMLPVRVGTGSTWEGAMIDTLTRRIYRNAGTGAFTYGNDLKYPIPA